MELSTESTPPAEMSLIRRDQAVTLAALVILCLLAWVYLARMSQAMSLAAGEAAMHAAMGMSSMAAWSALDTFMLFVMWSVMMAGMMLPSAAPVMLLVTGTYRRRNSRQARLSSLAFIAGYLAAWAGFSASATLLQLALHRAALLSEMMNAKSPLLAGGIFLVAGFYQWAPWKRSCLTHCHSPLHFLTTHWREGIRGGFGMGLRHGAFCVGCCWALMLLLFAAGVMNLWWVAAISVFVLAEKLLPRAPILSRIAGILLIAWGAYLLIQKAPG